MLPTYQGGFALVPTVILIQFESRGPEHHLICLVFLSIPLKLVLFVNSWGYWLQSVVSSVRRYFERGFPPVESYHSPGKSWKVRSYNEATLDRLACDSDHLRGIMIGYSDFLPVLIYQFYDRQWPSRFGHQSHHYGSLPKIEFSFEGVLQALALPRHNFQELHAPWQSRS